MSPDTMPLEAADRFFAELYDRVSGDFRSVN